MDIFQQIMSNKPLWVTALAFSVAQLSKLLFCLIKSEKIDRRKLLASGGMPSSHSALVTALAVSIGKEAGFSSYPFAICVALAVIVMYDAAGVRRAAGEQAILMNVLFEKIEEMGVKMDERLKEFLGHRPIEVFVGALLGILIGVLV